MKNLITLLTILVSTSVLYAQYPPPPITTSTSSSTSTYSISESDDDGSNKNTNISISISNSEEEYSIRAKFPKEKYTEILDLLKVEMSSNHMTTSNGNYTWGLDSGRNEVYKVSLNANRLSMYLDKTNTSPDLAEKFSSLGNVIRSIITGNNTEDLNAERLQRDADELYKKADRMREEAERLRNMAEKDSDKLYREAVKLKVEADKAMNSASYNGSISTLTLNLLKERKTIYTQDNQNNNWVWPLVQPELLELLLSSRLIASKNEVHFVNDRTGMYANGVKLNASKVASINKLLNDKGVAKQAFFKFDKQENHIVLIDENATIKNVFKELASAGFIDASANEVLLEINGNTILRNGTQLQHREVSQMNAILKKNNIIPAPGKVLAKNSKGYRLGYTIKRGAHFGTWVMM